MRKLRIGLDFHGVVKNRAAWIAHIIQQKYRIYIPSEFCTREFVTDPSKNLLTLKDWKAIEKEMDQDRDENKINHIDLFSIPEAEIYIRSLLKDGHYLACVTHSRKAAFKRVKKYFEVKKLGVKCITSIDFKDKLPIVKEKRFDVFADDKYSNLEPMIGVVPYLFLFSGLLHGGRLYNAANINPRITIVNQWDTFYRCVNTISNLHN